MGVEMHTQAVLVPGRNDGAHLDRTIADLQARYPAVQELSVVPVGLTRHHPGSLRPYTDAEAAAVLDPLLDWQAQLQDEIGTRFVYPSDEWYLRAGRPVPPVAAYADVLDHVSFDGFRETPEFGTAAAATREAFGPGLAAALPIYVGGFGLFLAGFAVAAWATAGRLGRPTGGTAGRLAPTVIPVAAAYELAHNVDYLLLNAGRAVELLAAGAGRSVVLDPAGWLSLPAYWGLQVALVVLGHVVAVVAAHAVLSRLASTGGTTGRAHLPLTALMVAYTLVSLWTVSRPVVA
jgi:hypothetical protein